jgi:hypothetical protein
MSERSVEPTPKDPLYIERQRDRRSRLVKSLSALQNAKLRGGLTKSDEAAVDNFIKKAQLGIAFLDKELE